MQEFDWPCIHRGVVIGKVECGCSDPEPIYACNSPRSEIPTCILRKKQSGRCEHNRCNVCPVREPN